MQKQFTADELRLIRQKILALYLSLKETKNNCHLEKCTIGELVELKWRGSNDASGNPALSSALENYINQEKILVLAIEKLAQVNNEDLSPLDCDLDLLSRAIGKLSLTIEPYDYDTYKAVIDERTSSLESSDAYEQEINSIFFSGIDLDIEMYEVHAMNYLDNLMFRGEMTYDEYTKTKNIYAPKIEELKAARDRLFGEATDHINELKRQEKRAKGFFARFKKQKPSTADEEESEK